MCRSVIRCQKLSCSKNVVIKSLPISQTFLYTYKKIDFFKVSSFFIKDAKIITEVGQIFLAEKARFINITDTQKNPPRA